MNDVSKTISAFVIDAFLLGRAVDLRATHSFLDAGIIDSTGVLELVHFLEETYGVSVADEEMIPSNLDSLENLVRYVALKTGMSSC